MFFLYSPALAHSEYLSMFVVYRNGLQLIVGSSKRKRYGQSLLKVSIAFIVFSSIYQWVYEQFFGGKTAHCVSIDSEHELDYKVKQFILTKSDLRESFIQLSKNIKWMEHKKVIKVIQNNFSIEIRTNLMVRIVFHCEQGTPWKRPRIILNFSMKKKTNKII